MKNKLIMFLVSILPIIGILSIPAGLLVFTILDTKSNAGYNNFNVIVISVIVALISLTLYFIISRIRAYRRIKEKYNEILEKEYNFMFENDPVKETGEILKQKGFQEINIPKIVYVTEQPLKSGGYSSKVYHIAEINAGTRNEIHEYIKNLYKEISEYYKSGSIKTEVLLGVVCFIFDRMDEKTKNMYRNIKDYIKYEDSGFVTHIAICAIDKSDKSLWFNNDSMSDKRNIIIRMVTDIFTKR